MRRNNEIPVKVLLFGASILMTCLFISLGVREYTQSKETSTAITSQISSITADLKESSITQYDGLEVTGNDVINFYKKHFSKYSSGESSEFSLIINNTFGTYSYIDGTYLSSLRDSTSDRYVKPTSIYVGEVVKNKNEIILAVKFKLK